MTRSEVLTEGGETGGLFRMVSKMMQREATKNKDVNIDALMNLLGRYYQIRDDYQDITGTVRPPSQYIIPLSHCSQVSREVCILQRSRPRELHFTHYPCFEISRRERQHGTRRDFPVRETDKWFISRSEEVCDKETERGGEFGVYEGGT
jgi:hypothetical protein